MKLGCPLVLRGGIPWSPPRMSPTEDRALSADSTLSPGCFFLCCGRQIAPDGAESSANPCGKTLHGCDRAQRNQGGYESVLDEVLSGFVVKQILENFHLSFLHFDYPSKTERWWYEFREQHSRSEEH